MGGGVVVRPFSLGLRAKSSGDKAGKAQENGGRETESKLVLWEGKGEEKKVWIRYLDRICVDNKNNVTWYTAQHVHTAWVGKSKTPTPFFFHFTERKEMRQR